MARTSPILPSGWARRTTGCAERLTMFEGSYPGDAD